MSDLADPPAEALRVRRSSSRVTAPDELERLAADPAVLVRAALAINPAAPPAAHARLAQDPDPRVRALLAGKLAALAPALTEAEQGLLQRQTWETLSLLVEDTAEQVRAAIAEVVRAMPEAPRRLILRLARDTAIAVSEPVLRLSPILTEADLMALLRTPPCPEAATAIARRPGLAASVADAIAAGGDDAAIRALLANPSAQLREAALDGLIARAAAHETWHAPLVRRPLLPPRAARALAGIVATQLLDELAHRADLDATLAAELRARLNERIAADAPGGHAAAAAAEAEAHRIARAGRLTEASISGALKQGEPRLAAALLAMAAALPLTAIDSAVRLRNAKALTALVWKAGFSMSLAARLQTDLARLGPAEVLAPGPRGAFPMTAEEMRWQLDLLRTAG